LILTGCTTEGTTTALEAIDAGAGVAGGVSAIWPPAAIVGVILTAIAGAWRKTNPVLAAAKSNQEKYYNAAATIIAAIDAFKINAPADYQRLKEELTRLRDLNEKTIGTATEEVIREIRGLPAIKPPLLNCID
jgi:hypothetical protein